LKLKFRYFLPIILILVSIFSWFIADRQIAKLDLGKIYLIDNQEIYTYYQGDYQVIINNIDYDTHYFSIESREDYLYIASYDSDKNLQKEFSIILTITDQQYDKTIIKSIYSTELIEIEGLSEYLITYELEENTAYTYDINRLDTNSDENIIQLFIFNVPKQINNLKVFMESLSITFLIFSVLSVFAVFATNYSEKKKNNERRKK
jgi:hypothetical protein